MRAKVYSAAGLMLLLATSFVVAQAPVLPSDASGRNPVLVGKLLKVVDGDSLVVELQSGPIGVRLDSIDAPEYDQPGGSAAAAHLAELLRGHETVKLDVETQDDYKRLIARVYVEDAAGTEKLLNAEMAKSGHAWAYRRYMRDTNYCRWEAAARDARIGLWALEPSQWIYPPQYRRLKLFALPADPAEDFSAETAERCIARIGKH
jgi:micrococcal nuclease